MWENGQRDRLVDSMLRVDHAGEYGAVRICAGQLDVLRWTNPEAARVVEVSHPCSFACKFFFSLFCLPFSRLLFFVCVCVGCSPVSS